MLEIAPLNAAEKECLNCALDICDDRSKECRYVQITRQHALHTPSVRGGSGAAWHTPESRAKAAAKTSETRRLQSGWLRDAAGNWTAKPCISCKEVLPLDAFYRNRTTGFPSGQCKPCHRRTLKLSYKGSTRQEVMDSVREMRAEA